MLLHLTTARLADTLGGENHRYDLKLGVPVPKNLDFFCFMFFQRIFSTVTSQRSTFLIHNYVTNLPVTNECNNLMERKRSKNREILNVLQYSWTAGN